MRVNEVELAANERSALPNFLPKPQEECVSPLEHDAGSEGDGSLRPPHEVHDQDDEEHDHEDPNHSVACSRDCEWHCSSFVELQAQFAPRHQRAKPHHPPEQPFALGRVARPVWSMAEHEQPSLGDLLGRRGTVRVFRSRAIVGAMPKGEGGTAPRTIKPRNVALAAMVLSSASWFVLLFAGFGGKASTCPEGDATWVEPVALACAVIATLAMAAAIWAYRATAGEPSGEWLLGAAGLYVTTLAWAGTLTGAVALFFVDVCSL
jgi:hypothetical protein